MSGLPKGWALTTVDEIADYNPKHSKDLSGTLDVSFVPMPVINENSPDIGTHNTRRLEEVKKGYTHFADGDVLLAKITPCFENGKAAIARNLVNGIGCGTTELHVLRSTSGVVAEYLYHFVHREEFRKYAKTQMTGTAGQLRVPSSIVKELEVPLPPLNEQHRIVEKLDHLLPKVESCKERLDKIPAILKRFRQSVLAAACSGALTKDWRGTSELSGWTFDKAENVCAKVQSGGTPKNAQWLTEGVPFLKVYNIVNQEIDFDYRPQFVAKEIHKGPLGKSVAYPDDVVMNIVGPPLGKVAILPTTHKEWNLNQAITLFRPSGNITSKWLYYMLCSGVNVAEIDSETRGSAGQSNISLSQCRAFIFPIPPMKEQIEITRRIEKWFKLADRLEGRLQAGSNYFGRLGDSILARAFSGTLVSQDPNDEPASVLLERIRQQRETKSSTRKQKTKTDDNKKGRTRKKKTVSDEKTNGFTKDRKTKGETEAERGTGAI